MNTPAPILVLDAAPGVSEGLSERLRQRGFAPIWLNLADVKARSDMPFGADLALILVGAAAAAEEGTPLAGMLHRLVAENVPTVVWGAKGSLKNESGPLVEWVSPDIGLDEVAGKVSTLARYVPLVKGLERELKQLRRLGEQLNRYFGEIDQEMRLAGRMQRDFLPRELPRVPPVLWALFGPQGPLHVHLLVRRGEARLDPALAVHQQRARSSGSYVDSEPVHISDFSP